MAFSAEPGIGVELMKPEFLNQEELEYELFIRDLIVGDDISDKVQSLQLFKGDAVFPALIGELDPCMERRALRQKLREIRKEVEELKSYWTEDTPVDADRLATLFVHTSLRLRRGLPFIKKFQAFALELNSMHADVLLLCPLLTLQKIETDPSYEESAEESDGSSILTSSSSEASYCSTTSSEGQF